MIVLAVIVGTVMAVLWAVNRGGTAPLADETSPPFGAVWWECVPCSLTGWEPTAEQAAAAKHAHTLTHVIGGP